MQSIDQHSLRQLFTEARTFGHWQDRGIAADTLRQLYQLAAMGPTSMNAQPGRFVFLTTPAAKQRLLQALAEGNREKTLAAPATVIVAHDPGFYRHLPELFPHMEGPTKCLPTTRNWPGAPPFATAHCRVPG